MAKGALLYLLIAASILATASAYGQEVDLKCSADGPEDTSLKARYEQRGRFEVFGVQFRAPAGGEFKKGGRLVVIVQTAQVGTITLRERANGDLLAKMEFDNAGLGEPFPDNFPVVEKDTRVRVSAKGKNVLGCRLR